MPEEQDKVDSGDEALLALIRRRFTEATSAEREIRAEATKDLEFISGEQWDEGAKRRRELADRPCLTINRLPTFVGQVVNSARQNKPSLKFSPVDSGADPDTAEVYGGIVRHIEYDSDADVAYDTAFEYAASCGFGAMRVLTEHVSDSSFDQELKIEAIPDPFSVYFDPHARRADRSDAGWGIVTERLSRDEYKENWPESKVAERGFETGIEGVGDWLTDDSIRVAEYWYIATTRKKLLLLSTGEVVLDAGKEALDQLIEQGVTVVRDRDVIQRQVKCVKTNGVEVLEKYDWPGRWIPIIPVLGHELIVKGKRKLFSLIRFARDPQQLYNFHKTAQAEALQIAPKAPFIGVEGQFAGHESEWEDANNVNFPYLEYRRVDLNGEPAPAPSRNAYEPPIQALSVSALQAADDIKATTGIFDPSLGSQSNEVSGLAIQRRQNQSDTANFHFIDNLARAQRHLGRIILDLIPKIYDTVRWVRILGEDMTQRIVQVNQQYEDEDGKTHNYALGVGKYDVRVSTGPGYATKRQEAFATLTEFGRSWPDLFKLGGDIIFRNSDIPGADELADRLKKALPPELTAEEEKGGETKIPPQVEAQMKAVMQQHEQLTAALKEAQELVNGKRMELESRERIEALKVQAQLAITQAKLDSEDGREMLRQELATLRYQIEQRLDMLRANEPVSDEQGAEAAPQPRPPAQSGTETEPLQQAA